MRKYLFIAILVLSSVIAVSEDINEGLVAYYPFDGDLKDKTGNFEEGYLVGNRINVPALGNPKFGEGVVGQALVFDGKRALFWGMIS